MAGFLGDDFDALKPEDSDSVKFGAEWIRDIKRRVKLFTSTLFNLETGDLRDNVVRHASMKDLLVPGTFTKVKVNSKGLVYEGGNSDEQKVAAYYTAMFHYGGRYAFETDNGYTEGGVTGTDNVYIADGVYNGSGAPFDPGVVPVTGALYSLFTFKPPAGVRRVKATIVGGGGGSHYHNNNSWYGGGGGELVETVFALDGSGNTALTIVVGQGGGASNNSVTAPDGCPSSVRLSDAVYAIAGAGKTAVSNAGGSAEPGSHTDSTLVVLRSTGGDGGTLVAGESGSRTFNHGAGGKINGQGGPGIVILEWIL